MCALSACVDAMSRRDSSLGWSVGTALTLPGYSCRAWLTPTAALCATAKGH